MFCIDIDILDTRGTGKNSNLYKNYKTKTPLKKDRFQIKSLALCPFPRAEDLLQSK